MFSLEALASIFDFFIHFFIHFTSIFWVNQIREKPDVLVSAIKDAQAAANYMDWKAELITEQEYRKLSGQTLEVSMEMIEPERVQDPAINAGLTEKPEELEPLAI